MEVKSILATGFIYLTIMICIWELNFSLCKRRCSYRKEKFQTTNKHGFLYHFNSRALPNRFHCNYHIISISYPVWDDSIIFLISLYSWWFSGKLSIWHRKARYLASRLLRVDQLVASLTPTMSFTSWRRKKVYKHDEKLGITTYILVILSNNVLF